MVVLVIMQCFRDGLLGLELENYVPPLHSLPRYRSTASRGFRATCFSTRGLWEASGSLAVPTGGQAGGRCRVKDYTPQESGP